MTTFRAKIFESKDGDRFLVPGYWYDVDDVEASSTSIMFSALTLCAVCGCKTARGWLEVETDASGIAAIPNQPYNLVGRQFAHGAVPVMLIGGPCFEECWKADHPGEPVPQSPLTDDEKAALEVAA